MVNETFPFGILMHNLSEESVLMFTIYMIVDWLLVYLMASVYIGYIVLSKRVFVNNVWERMFKGSQRILFAKSLFLFNVTKENFYKRASFMELLHAWPTAFDARLASYLTEINGWKIPTLFHVLP